MNTLGVELAWLAVRVTIVAAIAMGLVALCGRRGARSGVVVLAGTMVVLPMLSLSALVPLPEAWRWSVIESANLPKTPLSTNEPTDMAVSLHHPDSDGKSIFANLIDWLGRWGSHSESTPRTAQWGWGLVAITYVLGVGVGALHLLVGWRQLRWLQRRSRPITDPQMLAFANELSVKLCCA